MFEDRAFIDVFLEFESTYNMFEVKINTVKIWHYIRFNIYYNLLSYLGISKIALSVSSVSDEYKKGFQDYFRENILCNQKLATHRDILIIPHERKYRIDERHYKCIYTDLIDRNIKQSHYILDKKSVFDEYTPQKSRNIIYAKTDRFEKRENINNPYQKCKVTDFEAKIIKPMEEFFHITFPREMKIKWKTVLDDYLYRRRYLLSYYTYMLNRIKPKIILLVVSHSFDRMILCETAQKKNIPVVELMHGTIGKDMVHYCFHEKMQLSSFPDFLFTFGKKECIERLPISGKRVIPVGFPELESYAKNKGSHHHKKRNILFISQGQAEIAQTARKLADCIDLDKYSIIYKLHPKEYGDWQRELGQYLMHRGITVVGDYNHTVYEYLAAADWVVGSYSTVLYEATAFDIRIAILKTSLYSSVEKLYKNSHAVLVEGVRELKEVIEENAEMNNPTDEFFEMNSLDNIQRNINRIIKYYDRKRGKHYVKFSHRISEEQL